MGIVTPSAAHVAHPTTKDRCRIFHVGLDARETLVIESVFRANPALATRYAFGAPQSGDAADIMFVNGDDAAALVEWERIRQERPFTVPIYVTSKTEQFTGHRCIQKPLGFRNFVSIIESITSAVDGKADAQPSDDRSSLRVLVVDDSFPARQFMQFKLEELADPSAHLAIHFADSGEMALLKAAEIGFDLVFLDVVMPGMDGYEVCQKIKAMQPARVAMLTGRNASVDFARGREVGCDSYLTKPPNDNDLRSILRLVALKKEIARH